MPRPPTDAATQRDARHDRRRPPGATEAGAPRTSSRRSPPGAGRTSWPRSPATGLGALIDAAAATPRPAPDRGAAGGARACTSSPRSSASSPSAGRIAAADEDIVARARAYEAGGAAAISVLCEPHWFGGSVDDLRAVRAAVAIPVLAKDFVVEEIQLPILRAAGADLVLLLAVLHPARRLARLVDRALEIGLEPLVEVHDARELDRALATRRPAHRAQQPRPADARGGRRARRPAARARPGRSPRHRRIGRPRRPRPSPAGARSGSTARSSARRSCGRPIRPRRRARSSRPVPRRTIRPTSRAGRSSRSAASPTRPASSRRSPPGPTRSGSTSSPARPASWRSTRPPTWPGIARAARAGDRRPTIVAITADAGARRTSPRSSPPSIPTSSSSPAASRSRQLAAVGRPDLEGPPPPADGARRRRGCRRRRSCRAAAPTSPPASTGSSSTPPAGRIPGGTGTRALGAPRRRDRPRGAGRPRRRPRPGQRRGRAARRSRRSASTSRRASSGRAIAGERPVKDPLRVALFVKRARAARDDRPNVAVRADARSTPACSTPTAPGAGGWSATSAAATCPETLMAALEQLETAYDALRQDPVFWAELRELLGARSPAARPPLYRADRLAAAVRDRGGPAGRDARRPARRRRAAIPGLRLYLKREDLAHTGRAQDQQRPRPGAADAAARQDPGHRRDRRRPARRRDRDRLRPARPAVRRVHGRRGHRAPGPERAPDARARRRGPLGHVRHGDAQGRGQRGDARLGHERRRRPTTSSGSAMGPHPYPTIVRDLQRRIGDEAAAQLQAVEGRLPDLAVACVGGGSNAIGLLARFIGEPAVRLAVVEAAGDGIETGRHAAAILGGTPGILHGSRSLMLQDADGQVIEAHSASAGLDYPGIGPQLAALAEGGRIEVAAATDREAVAAMKTTTRTEGILPALETAHAVAALPKLLAGVGGVGGGVAGRGRWSCSGSPVAATRTWPRSSGSPTSSRGRATDDDAHRRHRRRAAGPTAATRPARTGPPAPDGSPPPSPGRGPRAAPRSSRTSSPATRTRTRASRSPSPRPTPGRTCSRSACRTRIRWRTAPRSSAPRASRSPRARPWSGRSG